jgi:hypothetical protein
LVLLCHTAQADLPLARLLTIFPAGGKAGNSFEVTITGNDLDGLSEIRFSHPGITARAAKPEGTNAPTPNRFTVSIAVDVPVGKYEARVRGEFGISNPRFFEVGDLPELAIPQPATDSTNASVVPLGTVINARAVAGQFSFYKFGASRGQRVLVDCTGEEMDSRMIPVLLLYNSSGQELERSRAGGLLDFTTPADGDFLIKVHDALFRGGDEYGYRLAISTRPHLDFIMPPCGLPGSTDRYRIVGRNLPGGKPVADLATGDKKLEQLEVEIRLSERAATLDQGELATTRLSGASVDGMLYRLSSTNGTSNPILIGFTPLPIIVEREPNNTPQQAQSLRSSCEFAGQFYPAGDRDWLTLQVPTGSVNWIEVISERLGLSTAPFLLVQRVESSGGGASNKVEDVQEIYPGEPKATGVELNTVSRDPAWRFDAKQGGEYRIQVRDLFSASVANPADVYRLSIHAESPDFQLIALSRAPPPADKDKREAHVWTTLLRRGETLPVQVLVLRRDGFKGEIELGAEGLPLGVSYSPATMPSEQTSALLTLTAAENATAWAGPVRIIGRAKSGGTELMRQAKGGCLIWDVGDYNAESVRSRLSADFDLAVSGDELAPLTVEPAEDKTWEIAAGGKVSLPLKMLSRAEITSNTKLRLAGLPALDSMNDLEVNTKTNEVNLELDLSKQRIPAGVHRAHILARTTVKYRRPALHPAADKDKKPEFEERTVVVYSKPLTLKINPGP